MTRKTREHETFHALADGCALIALDVDKKQYEACKLHLTVNSDGSGECALETPARFPDELHLKAAQLGALGPIAQICQLSGKSPQENAASLCKLVQKGDWAAISDAGNLSQRDLDLATQWDGVPTIPLIVVLATQHLYQRLGMKGFTALSKVLEDAGNQNHQLGLDTVIPRTAAQAAMRVAKRRFEDFIDPPITKAEAAKRAKQCAGNIGSRRIRG